MPFDKNLQKKEHKKWLPKHRKFCVQHQRICEILVAERMGKKNCNKETKAKKHLLILPTKNVASSHCCNTRSQQFITELLFKPAVY